MKGISLPFALLFCCTALFLTALFAGCRTPSVDRTAHDKERAHIVTEQRAPWAFQETDDAWAALRRKDYAEAARYYSNAVAKGATIRAATPNSGMGDPNDVEYNAARCYSKLGSNRLSFRFLNLALAAAPMGDLRRDPDVLRREPDLAPLHETKEWQRMIRRLTAEREKYLKTVNPRIYELFKDDQMDLAFLDWSDQEAVKRMSQRRGERRTELDRILASGQSLSADDDYFCALLIEHTAKDAEDSERSNRLAEEAVRRGCRFPHARWLIAVHRDRKLWRERKPQAYGTQVRRDRANGDKWTLEPLDPTAVTDAERRELNVPSLAARRKEIDVWNVPAAKSADANRPPGNSAYPPKLEGARSEVYKKIGGADLQLFIFAPEQHKHSDSRPAIVFFFGGSWTSGSPKQFEQQCRYFASRGLVAIAADFRVGSRHGVKPVQCVADAKSAIRWARTNAKRLGIDPKRIVATGGSSGGHLATAAAVVAGFEDESEDKAVSSAPNALVLFNPALVMAPLDGKELDAFGASFFTSERLGAEPVALSPAHHVKAGAPPTIIFHGRADTSIPFFQMEMFAEKMKGAGNRCELVGYDDQTHGFFNYGRSDNRFFRDTLKRADEFLASLEYLAGKPRVDEFFPQGAPETPKP
jgi:acetyl esterase